MSRTVDHRAVPADGSGFRVSLMPGTQRRVAGCLPITAFVDRDVDTGERSLRFELQLDFGGVISVFGLKPGFTDKPLALGWVITHNATVFDDADAVSLVDVSFH